MQIENEFTSKAPPTAVRALRIHVPVVISYP